MKVINLITKINPTVRMILHSLLSQVISLSFGFNMGNIMYWITAFLSILCFELINEFVRSVDK